MDIEDRWSREMSHLLRGKEATRNGRSGSQANEVGKRARKEASKLRY